MIYNYSILFRGGNLKDFIIKSLNDKGNAVNIDVWIFNYQNGVNINYNTGTYQKV